MHKNHAQILPVIWMKSHVIANEEFTTACKEVLKILNIHRNGQKNEQTRKRT
jgi:hypothetical protein